MKEIILYGLISIAFIVGGAFIFSLPIMWLWNWLMPTIFGIVKITWTQALGLSILCGFLFRGNGYKN